MYYFYQSILYLSLLFRNYLIDIYEIINSKKISLLLYLFSAIFFICEFDIIKYLNNIFFKVRNNNNIISLNINEILIDRINGSVKLRRIYEINWKFFLKLSTEHNIKKKNIPITLSSEKRKIKSMTKR